MDTTDEAYILLLLSDGNLPTGSFVASAGLESYAAHGFLSSSVDKGRDKINATVDFVRDSLSAYARSALPFVSDTHRVVQDHTFNTDVHKRARSLQSILDDLITLDNLYETTTLSHVARRASKSQGVALLTLYTKGFSPPPLSSPSAPPEQPKVGDKMSLLVDKFKLLVRREDTHGHLPVCWGILTVALGLSLGMITTIYPCHYGVKRFLSLCTLFYLERSQFLHLFLHARSLLSAAVRLNSLGPYAAQQLLLHTIQPIVNVETARCADLRTGLRYEREPHESAFDEDVMVEGPAMTWPLGEILASRHDLQHSRIFNS